MAGRVAAWEGLPLETWRFIPAPAHACFARRQYVLLKLRLMQLSPTKTLKKRETNRKHAYIMTTSTPDIKVHWWHPQRDGSLLGSGKNSFFSRSGLQDERSSLLMPMTGLGLALSVVLVLSLRQAKHTNGQWLGAWGSSPLTLPCPSLSWKLICS